ncbi:MAG TPA: tetratricopeptide repeat protein [Bryobacteraceae bacterium]|nr:tetratricopeptide repeat protein [Bryobacteraceae bacterium]
MPWRRYPILFPIAAALLTFLVFLPALNDDFLNWDDATNFLQNTDYRGLGWAQLKWMWTSHLIGRYVPLTWMTLGLDYTIWKMNPFGYHLTNILFHAANALVFYFIALALYRIAIPDSEPRPSGSDSKVTAAFRTQLAALLAALLFAIHPLRAESVAWVTERRDVVSGLFYLLAILAYVRAFDGPDRPLRRKYYYATLALFALALLSKEITVTLPVVLLLLDLYPLRRLGGAPGRWIGKAVRHVWLEKLPFFALTIADTALALIVAQHETAYASLRGTGLLTRTAAAVYSLAFYIWKTVVPLHLTPFYPLTPHKIDPWAAPLELSTLVALSLTIAAILLWRRFPALLVVWLAYAVTLVPVLGFLDNGPQITADRYSYLACLGWALFAGAAMLLWNRDRRRPWFIPAAAGVAILALGGLTWRQVQVWRDSETLWAYTLATEPSFLAYVNMGNLLADHGDYLWALDHFRQAVKLNPDFPSAHLGLGGALLSLNHADEAAREFQIALDLGERREFAENGLACSLALEGKLDEAIAHFNEALRIQPKYADARRNLNQVLARKKN